MSETKVVTGKVRASYAHVFHPKSAGEGTPEKYSISLLIPKDDEKTVAKIEAAIEAAIENGKAKLGKFVKSKLKTPLRDGDEERPDDAAYEGMYFLNATSNTRPGIIDRNKVKIVEDPDDPKHEIDQEAGEVSEEEFYSGCYCRASLNMFAYNTQGNKGVGCGLNNLQKLDDGERLAGGASAQADFADDLEDDDLM